jgi:hypothetical protein
MYKLYDSTSIKFINRSNSLLSSVIKIVFSFEGTLWLGGGTKSFF